MAIRNDDWPAIHAAIDKAIAPLKPRGWKKALHLLREWSVLGTIGTVFIALLALSATAFYQATARVGKEAIFETSSGDTLKAIDEHLKKIDVSLATIEIERAAVNPGDKKSAVAAKKTISDALAESIQLPPEVIEETGKKFIDVSSQIPAAWDAAIAFVNYRSFLNAIDPDHYDGTQAAYLTSSCWK